MTKKTLENYKQEFAAIPSPRYPDGTEIECLNKYELLAKECIADYPDEDLGYVKLGNTIAEFSEIGKIDEIDAAKIAKFKELSLLTEKDNRYIKTIEILLQKLYPRYSSIVGKYDLTLIYRIKKKEFASIYFLCGELYASRGEFKEAADEFKIAWELGVDYKAFIQLINQPICFMNIENKHCIRDLTVNDIGDCKEIYFLGENGVGKTLLLQSIITGIDDNYSISAYGSENERTISYQNLFAYGTARFRTGSPTDDFFDKTGFDTLFDRNKLLRNPQQFFTGVDYRAMKKLSSIKIETVLNTFEEIIDLDIKIKQEGIDFVFYEKGTRTEFNHLAEGFRSVLIWLCDLLSRLMDNQPYIENLEDFYGVVLVDEIDMFLHPKWEYKIVRKLRAKLPNIQWFFTTHSPILILGASDDAVFYKLYKNEQGETQIGEQWTCRDIDNLLANALITSPLFDMDTARMKGFAASNKELDTSRDYVESRLRMKIDARIEQHKKENYEIERSEIDAIIDQAIDEITKTTE